MKTHRIVATGLALAFLAGSVWAAGTVKSGPQVDEKLAGPFHPLNVTGESAGKKNCLYCQNGNNPVAMIFAREVTPEVTKLIKKVDECTAKNGDCSMGSFVVFLSDAEGLDRKLESMAKEQGITKCVLSIDNPAGPKGYKVSKDADVTVVLYTERTVKANHSFKKGELTDKDIAAIAQDVSKITKK
ncbi:MAG TPA: hypothetical protein VFE78_01315 [Gemmataceae bacterium]|jgi:hypothetical protein|nr:hypothetical protein [Gemmataceae bacterium]